MSRINDLRKQVYQEQKRATAKLSRLEDKGIKNTKGIDPRKHGSWVAHASSRELNSQLSRLQKFNSRTTQYVPDAYGRPMNGKLWRQYKTEERRANKWRSEFYDSVKNVKLDNGVTIDQRNRMQTYRHSAAINDFRKEKNISSRAFISEKKMSDAINALKKSNKRGPQGTAEAAREHFLSIVTTEFSGTATKWADDIMKLDDKTFLTLWTATDFKKNLGEYYSILKAGLTDATLQIGIDREDELERFVTWATDPKTQKTLNRKPRSRGKKKS